ncbi:MAG: aldose 1-epimerase family protein [Candidatus Eremiobacteraeota bacterium]|nr:aldose 1-epimerase family protein [Candidatus Eremiobacteraeota bacterium]
MDKTQLLARVGSLEQYAGITPFAYTAGRSAGVRAFHVRTGTGLEFTAVADRALDICAASFQGTSLAWQSSNGVAAAAYYDPSRFDETFFGGLVTTCGLTAFGPPGHDAYGRWGQHGRVNHLPASELCHRVTWEGQRCFFDISGIMHETRLFGEQLTLERTLRAELGSNTIVLRDRVTNEGGSRSPHMLLYHCNAGFPLLDDATEISLSTRSTTPRDEEAARGLAVWNRGAPPQADFREQVFIHEPLAEGDGLARAIVKNPTLRDGRGLALAIAFDPAQLPAAFSWRMLGVKDYVMAIEPANCNAIAGRIDAEKRGVLPFLEPGETREYMLEFSVIP